MNQNLSYSPETPNLGQIRRFLEPCDLEIWRMTLRNNRAPLQCYYKLCASFHRHWCFQTGVTVQRRPILVKFDRWPWITIRHLFNATWSFVHHFVAIGEFKLELKSGNAQSGSNSMIFRAVWPWNWMDDLEKQLGTSSRQHQAICIISSSYVNSNLSYSPETVKLGCDLCDLDLWPLTLTFCMDLTWVIDNNSMKISWWYNNGNIVKKVWQTDSRTDRQIGLDWIGFV